MRDETAHSRPRTRFPGIASAALLIGVFVLAQWAENGLSSRLGWAWGGLISGLVLFTLSPVQRRAESRRERGPAPAAPSTDLTRVYRAQARLAWSDGVLTSKERLQLDQLRIHLGLDSTKTARIEDEERPVAVSAPGGTRVAVVG